jgi:hypothetical protein
MITADEIDNKVHTRTKLRLSFDETLINESDIPDRSVPRKSRGAFRRTLLIQSRQDLLARTKVSLGYVRYLKRVKEAKNLSSTSAASRLHECSPLFLMLPLTLSS